MFWNDPLYKPKNKICEEAWIDFMRAALIILYLDSNVSKEDKAKSDYIEPDVYSVFNKLRQDYHNELPYSKKFIEPIDRSVEKEIERERKSTRCIGYLPSGDRGSFKRD